MDMKKRFYRSWLISPRDWQKISMSNTPRPKSCIEGEPERLSGQSKRSCAMPTKEQVLKRMAEIEGRFWEKVEKTEACWNWTGALYGLGYGHYRDGSKKYRAHRYVYEKVFGAIPDGAWVLHHCDNPSCVNPEHLYLGDQFDNARDRDGRGRNASSRKTKCPKGHEYTPGNTYVYGSQRQCRICRNEHKRKWWNEHGRNRRQKAS